MIAREVLTPSKSRRAEALMAALCGIGIAMCVAGTVARERFVDQTSDVTSAWSSEWVTIGPAVGEIITRLSPSSTTTLSVQHKIEGFGLILATGVRYPQRDERHAAALCLGDWRALIAAEHCVYFDEAPPP